MNDTALSSIRVLQAQEAIIRAQHNSAVAQCNINSTNKPVISFDSLTFTDDNAERSQTLVECGSIINDSTGKSIDVNTCADVNNPNTVQCKVFLLDNDTIQKYSPNLNNKTNIEYIVPCNSINNLDTNLYTFNKNDTVCTIIENNTTGLTTDSTPSSTINSNQTILNISDIEFTDNTGIVKCGVLINTKLNDKYITIDTKNLPKDSNDNCIIKKITDISGYTDIANNNNDPTYKIPCTSSIINLPLKYKIYTPDNDGNCLVKHKTLPILFNDEYTFTSDNKSNISCMTKFTGFTKTNTVDSTSTDVCYQNCKNGAPFYLLENGRPFCKYRPSISKIDDKNITLCQEGTLYNNLDDISRLNIGHDEIDNSGMCILLPTGYNATLTPK